MKYIRFSFFLFLAVFSLVGGSWGGGQHIGESSDGFSAGVWITTSKAVMENDSQKTSATIPVTNFIEPGEPAYLIVVFSHTLKGQSKEVFVEYDVEVLQPNGEIFAEMNNAVGWQGFLGSKESGASVGSSYLELILGEEELYGRYLVRAEVREKKSGTVLELQQYFDVPRFPIFQGYDFSYDYRAEKKAQQPAEQQGRQAGLEEKGLGASQEVVEDSKLLEPVEGVSFQQWAVICARRVYGESIDVILKREAINKGAWEKAEKAWLVRMREDTTYSLNRRYSAYFYGAGIGKYHEAGRDLAQAITREGKLQADPPVPEKEWVEIAEEIQREMAKGGQMDTVLKARNINPYDWYVISNWWARAKVDHLQ